MKVKVDELPESGKVIYFRETDVWFSSRMSSVEEAREITLVRPVEVNLELIPEREQVRLGGYLETAVGLPCSRCLQDFVLELDETLELVLLKSLPHLTPEEIDLSPQDLDTEFYDGVTIDVGRIVTEQIFLALPQKPLCKPECRGLCSSCGADLNHESCLCKSKDPGSAFDVLLSLKIE